MGLILFSFSSLFGQISFPDFRRVIVRFGQIANKEYPNKENPYLETSILVETSEGPLRHPGTRKVVFIQNRNISSSDIAASMPALIAVSQENDLVSVYSGDDLLPHPHSSAEDTNIILATIEHRGGTATPQYSLRIYDPKKKAWLNPVLFAPNLEDRGSPQIEEVVLQGKDLAYRFQKSSRNRSRLPQGRYFLEIEVEDVVRTNSVSGLYYFRLVLNGSLIFEKKLDSAPVNERGLSFFGFAPPSSKAAGKNGTINVGELSLIRGQHNLEIIVTDYSGNATAVHWPIIVE